MFINWFEFIVSSSISNIFMQCVFFSPRHKCHRDDVALLPKKFEHPWFRLKRTSGSLFLWPWRPNSARALLSVEFSRVGKSDPAYIAAGRKDLHSGWSILVWRWCWRSFIRIYLYLLYKLNWQQLAILSSATIPHHFYCWNSTSAVRIMPG